nr:hypothetical protein [Candidatus Sigynarchaeota archaeon]
IVQGVHDIDNKELHVDGVKLSLQRSLKQVEHSPTGFNWGYKGSGCAQSAHAILQHVFGNDFAMTYHEMFKACVIEHLDINKSFKIKVTVELKDEIPEFKVETIELPVAKHVRYVTRIHLKEEYWIDVNEESPGMFVIVSENMTTEPETELGFSAWDKEVEDRDNGASDGSSCFGISSHLKWNDVELFPDSFKAPSIERLKEALAHVTMCAWDPWDL